MRFMPDGRLKTETGSLLDAGPWLTADDATIAARGGTRILLHSYPHTEEITSDVRRVAALLDSVSLQPELEGHSARLYRRGDERILVIEHRH